MEGQCGVVSSPPVAYQIEQLAISCVTARWTVFSRASLGFRPYVCSWVGCMLSREIGRNRKLGQRSEKRWPNEKLRVRLSVSFFIFWTLERVVEGAVVLGDKVFFSTFSRVCFYRAAVFQYLNTPLKDSTAFWRLLQPRQPSADAV